MHDSNAFNLKARMTARVVMPRNQCSQDLIMTDEQTEIAERKTAIRGQIDRRRQECERTIQEVQQGD